MSRSRVHKRRRVVRLQRWLVNPLTKAALRLGVVPGYAVIETTGRRSGRRRRVPVGVHLDDRAVWIVAEHGRHAGWVRNLEAQPEVRVRLRRRWHRGRATTLPDDDPEARLDRFGRALHGRAVRSAGTDLLTVRIDLDPAAGPEA